MTKQNKNMVALIARNMKGIKIKPGVSESWAWVIGDDVAEHLEHVAFFESQSGISYMGGKITKIESRGDRKIIHFIPKKYRVNGNRLNWGQEKAYANAY